MKKFLFINYLIIVNFLLSNPTIGAEDEKSKLQPYPLPRVSLGNEEAKKEDQVEKTDNLKQLSLSHLPQGIKALIGKMSGNTMSLREVSHSLCINYQTIREATILGHSPNMKAVLQSFDDNNPDFRHLKLFDDIISLNLYFLNRADFVRLGLHAQNPYEDYDVEKTKIFCEVLNEGRIRPIQHLIIRKSNPQEKGDGIHPLALTYLNQHGIKVHCIEDGNNSGIDILFNQLSDFTISDLHSLLQLTSIRPTQSRVFKISESTCLGRYTSTDPAPEGCLAMFYREENEAGVKHHITKEHLLRAIHAYWSITINSQCYMLTLAFNTKAFFLVDGLLSLGNSPEALNTIVAIHNMRLSFGQWLFGSDYETLRKNMEGIRNITHKDTAAILKLLRKFIPDFREDDYHNAPGKPYDKALKWHKLSNLYGRKDKDDLRFIEGLQRQDAFMDFLLALSTFDQDTQLVRLKKLIQILCIEHFSAIEKDDPLYNRYLGFKDRIILALQYLYDETVDINGYYYVKFAESFKVHNPDFNPLSMDAESKFKAALRNNE
jgi:hypothetical protein